MTDTRGRSTGPDSTVGTVASTASQEGKAVAQHAKDAAADVASTAKEQTRQVAHEAKRQTGQVVDDVRRRVGREADDQARRVSQGINKIADELSSMAEHSSEGSPAAGALRQVADTGRQAARFLDERGAAGLLESAQGFARRKPGAFLIGAAVAGFLVGRVVKSASGSSGSEQDTGSTGPGAPRPDQVQRGYTDQAQGGYADQVQGGYTAQPAVATPGPAPVPTAQGPAGAVVPPTVRPEDPLAAPRPTPHTTPGGGAAHVQP
ncbi:hypothetical protein FHS29_005201 [Saccharothrix tamanrassetensis]|uniref:DUF3618 domain-containing protein n=1 Tax=Saccharothrix tamanrassetensis TaxID=1051531 RepID=A0A841CNV2_9PSEU|nr:hypothetical protein [Saccharothrix tamanrassetensis]MBB5958593.1 hypothetical protein [Saccharothrix tamanrassetensis]